MQTITDTKTEKVAEIIKRTYTEKIDRLLVVGCGDGTEAAVLASKLSATVVGIDVVDAFHNVAAILAELRLGDAMNLDFPDESFDFVFSYHALEHISGPMTALREMRRVLRPGGGFWIGTPNRTRLVGYIGAKEGTLREKITWNVADYRARLAGRFRNEFGAHAGFSAGELEAMLSEVFPVVADASKAYFQTVYAGLAPIPALVSLPPLNRVLFPSIYFTGTK